MARQRNAEDCHLRQLGELIIGGPLTKVQRAANCGVLQFKNSCSKAPDAMLVFRSIGDGQLKPRL